MTAIARHPTNAFACLSEQCRSPLACAGFGYCRGLNLAPVNGPICTGCLKRPAEIEEYVEGAKPENWGGDGVTPDAYVIAEEGTYNPDNGHFYCTACHDHLGRPVGVAP